MNKKAYYGEFGGQYVAESLMNTLEELDKAFEEAIHDPEFIKQYHYYLKQYVGLSVLRFPPLCNLLRMLRFHQRPADQECIHTAFL